MGTKHIRQAPEPVSALALDINVASNLLTKLTGTLAGLQAESSRQYPTQPVSPELLRLLDREPSYSNLLLHLANRQFIRADMDQLPIIGPSRIKLRTMVEDVAYVHGVLSRIVTHLARTVESASCPSSSPHPSPTAKLSVEPSPKSVPEPQPRKVKAKNRTPGKRPGNFGRRTIH